MNDEEMKTYLEKCDRKKQEWEQTEALQMIKATGLEYERTICRRIQSGFFDDKIDGSVDSLVKVVSGECYLYQFGHRSIQSLALAIIRWYQQRQ